MTTTFEKLDQLARLQDFIESYEAVKSDTRQALDAEKQKLIDSVLTPEILKKVEEIKAEFQPKYDLLENDEKYKAYQAEIETLTAEIKQEVITGGMTVKGSVIQAVYTKGRVTWDTKSLDGYAAAHPEIVQFRKVGDPSVAIRKV